jgi:hypothetical protein
MGGMRPISQGTDQELLWTQPAALKREYVLSAGNEVLATLRFHRGTLAAAETGGGRWTFKRQGFWQPRVTVRLPDSDADIALFHPRWTGGGQLEFQQGRTLRLSSANLWQSEWLWQENNRPLIRFKGRHGIVKAHGAVEIDPSAADDPDLALLVTLGWYLILLYAQDMAATSAATVAATTT